MLIVLVAAKHKLDYHRGRIISGLIDHLHNWTENSISTAIDKWIFIEPENGWYNKLRGYRIDRIYICRNSVEFTKEAKCVIIPALRRHNEESVVIF